MNATELTHSTKKRQEYLYIKKENRIEDNIPPTFIPVCLIPIAVARPLEGNQSMIALTPDTWIQPVPRPKTKSKTAEKKKTLLKENKKKKVPIVKNPQLITFRTPNLSQHIPPGIWLTMVPIAIALLRKPNFVLFIVRSCFKRGPSTPRLELIKK